MKRSFDTVSDGSSHSSNKVVLVERNPEPNGVALVNPLRVGTHTFQEPMELVAANNNANTFLMANSRNKLDIIGRQMRNLKDLMANVIADANLTRELNEAACNFVKKPGHIYHLFERSTGQKYFSMLSPEEWKITPHKFIGSYKLEADLSWVKAEDPLSKYEGLEFLSNFYNKQQLRELMDIS